MSPGSSQSYSPLSKESTDSDSSFLEKQDVHIRPKKSLSNRLGATFIRCLIFLAVALTVFKAWDFLTVLEVKLDSFEVSHAEVTSQQQPDFSGCTRPTIRRSWLTLTNAEKKSYLDAVKCLATKPSYMVPNTTLYDDFTWIHIKDGNLGRFFMTGYERC